MRYFIHIGFEGTNYSGWQRQKNTAGTVQEVIERALTKIFKTDMSVYGCGRTDTGVHASQYIAQINIDEAPSFDLKYRLNKNLPDDIAVFEIIEVEDDQHCRYDAVARTYDYFIHWKKDPILIRYSSFYEDLEFDFDLMRQAAALILNNNDFRPLCKQPDLYNNTLCTITNCQVFVNESQGRLRFTITSNRFLRAMVRYCIFYLLKVGTKELSIKEFKAILNQEQHYSEMRPAFPNGLFLSRIEYPFLELNTDQNLVDKLSIGLV